MLVGGTQTFGSPFPTLKVWLVATSTLEQVGEDANGGRPPPFDPVLEAWLPPPPPQLPAASTAKHRPTNPIPLLAFTKR
jgi:hypothetical protein